MVAGCLQNPVQHQGLKQIDALKDGIVGDQTRHVRPDGGGGLQRVRGAQPVHGSNARRRVGGRPIGNRPQIDNLPHNSRYNRTAIPPAMRAAKVGGYDGGAEVPARAPPPGDHAGL